MTIVEVPSIRAEETTRLLMSTLAQHRRQEALLTMGGVLTGRLAVLPSGRTSAEVRRQSTMLRFVSAVESFVVADLLTRLDSHVPSPRNTIVTDLHRRAGDDSTTSWLNMGNAYKKWFGIGFPTYPNWNRIQALTDVRNVIAHGLGEITHRLARKGTNTLRAEFRTIGVSIVNSAIEISEPSVRTSAEEARDFVLWLDQKLAAYDESV